MILKLFFILASCGLYSSYGKHTFSFIDNDATTASVNVRCLSKDRIADGEVQIPLKDEFFGYNVSFDVSADVDIPISAIPSGTGEATSTISVTQEDDNSVDLQVYALAYGTRGDSFMVLPENSLDRNYLVMTYQYVLGNPVFVITPLEQGTDVSIYFNQDFQHDGRTHNRNNPLKVSLNIRSYHVQTDFDPTGTFITSSKKVQIVSGNRCAGILSSTLCDHIAESLPPIKAWGLNYVLVPFASRSSGYVVRIMAAEDNTEVTLTLHNEIETVTLDEGSFEERVIAMPIVLTIASTKPILVAQFMRDYYKSGANNGNPSMVILPSIEHAIARSLPFTALNDTTFAHYVTVWMSKIDINGLRIDGEVVSSWRLIGVAFGGAVVQTEVSPGIHYLSHIQRSVRLCGIAYGHGAGTSYAHPIYYHPLTALNEESEPLRVECPSSVIEECPPDTNVAVVKWDPPKISSTNTMLPDYSSHRSGDTFNIGVTMVTYHFSDVYGQTYECSFQVEVNDVTPPAVYGCPSSFNVTTCDAEPSYTWQEPYAKDNSKKQPLVKRVETKNNKETLISYEFTDDSDNTATCLIVIENAGDCKEEIDEDAMAKAVVSLGLVSYFLIMIVCCQLIFRYLKTTSEAKKTDSRIAAGKRSRPNDYRTEGRQGRNSDDRS